MSVIHGDPAGVASEPKDADLRHPQQFQATCTTITLQENTGRGGRGALCSENLMLPAIYLIAIPVLYGFLE